MPKNKIYIGDKLSDEAKNFCKILQIDQNHLKPRNLDSFKEKGITPEVQRIRYEHYEDRRNQLIWQIDNAMKATTATSPTHQLILTNSASKYSDAFPKNMPSVVSSKPEIALRVPIDKDQIIQKQKAKLIYQEERLSKVIENKCKLEEEKNKKLEEKLKLEQKKAKEKEQIAKEEQKRKFEKQQKYESRRKQAHDNKLRDMKMLDRENRKRQNSMNEEFRNYLKK